MTQEKKKKGKEGLLVPAGIPGTGLAESLMSDVGPQILRPAALLSVTSNTMRLKHRKDLVRKDSPLGV